MIYVTRKERFNAAHRLCRADWTDAENFEVFGKCSNANWHGHNYELYITVKGEINPKTGFVVNLKVLSKIIKEEVTSKLDHKNLNLDVSFLKDKITSSENLTIAIWEQLEPKIKDLGIYLHSVKLLETEKNIVEYFG